MKFLPDNKQPSPRCIRRNKFIGTFNAPDGLMDITDPGYDEANWFNRIDLKVKPGTYRCYYTLYDFPYCIQTEKNDEIVKAGKAKAGEIITKHNRRIVELLVVHTDEIPCFVRWETVTKTIGVDSGLCGIYNHKPSFENQEEWMDFCQSLDCLPNSQTACDLKPYGVTVSSGFGDGEYSLYQYQNKDEVVGLKLIF